MLVSTLAAVLLQASTAQAAPPAVPPAQPGSDHGQQLASSQKICRTYRITGSRVKREKICRTASEWQKFDEANQVRGSALIGNGVCTGGDCSGT